MTEFIVGFLVKIMHTNMKRIEIFAKKTIVMGVLNVTPDSFSDGGEFFSVESAVAHAQKMIAEGVDIIDIGGESTRPGAEKVSAEAELERVIPVIVAIRKKLGREIRLSIDTYKSLVAKEAVLAGVNIINDVSGLQLDSQMSAVVAEMGVPIIINHMRGNPQTMQQGNIVYPDVIKTIAEFFTQQIALLKTLGVSKEKIILDPGFGFGKTVVQNLEILRRFGEFKKFNLPLMIGVSRKSTVGKILEASFKNVGGDFKPVPTDERLEGSLAATAVAVCNGATIVRTHDVGETKKFLAVLNAITHANMI